MDQIRITATPNRVVVSPTAPRIKIRLATGPQGPAGPPAEVYVQQTQPATPQNAGAIWYETDGAGQIQREHVWDGNQWLLTPTGTGISGIAATHPVTATGQTFVTIGIDAATETTPGAVARLATVADVANVTAGPVVDSQLLATMLATTVPQKTSDLTNDGDGVGGPYVDATGASLAAPIQSLIAGNDIHISNVGRDFIIAAVPNPEHQSDWLVTDTGNPAYIKNKPTNVSVFANDAGYITLAQSVAAAPVQSVNGMAGAVVIDLSPYATNVDLNATNAKFADYLPLAGGSVSGALTVAGAVSVGGAFNVGPAGTARVPTPGATDVSTAVATTEWVQTLLAATGAVRFMWKYGGPDVSADPGAGNLRIATNTQTIAISKIDGNGNARYLAPIAPGDTIVLTDDPTTGPATEYQRFDVTGTPTDNGGWLSIPVSLAGGTTPTRVVGEPIRVAIGLDSQAATIDGISAGYGLTGGGISGVVSLAIDTSVVAKLTDLPKATGDLANNGDGLGAGPFITFAAIPTNVSSFTNDSGYITLGQVPPSDQADWDELDTGNPAFIRNKPTAISTWSNDVGYTVPGANVSVFVNDAGYVTQSAIDTTVADYLPLAGGTMTGQIVTIAGTAAAPAIAFGDNSGIYQMGNGTFAIGTAGSKRMMFRADGGVGIGYGGAATHAFGIQTPTSGTGTHIGFSLTPAYSAGATGVYDVWDAPNIDGTVSNRYGFAVWPHTGTGTVATANGFWVGSGFTTATNNFGVRCQIPAGTGRWNIYCDGTAPNYFAGQILPGTSNATAPGYSFSGDTDTGIFNPDANTIAISTGGVERVRVRSDGNVGIGGVGASTHRLQIKQTNATVNYPVGIYLSQTVNHPNTKNTYCLLTDLTHEIDHVSQLMVGFQCNGVVMANGSIATFRAFSVSNFVGESIVSYTAYHAGVNAEANRTRFNINAPGTAPNYFAGQIQCGVGSAIAPSIGFIGSTSTGVYSPAANAAAVSTGGVERVRFKSTGGVRYVPLATAPANPDEGEVYFDSTTKKLRLYDGATWVDLH